jgi:MoaA/NifB/PqqE/SkfB family radical SAM enzyme
MSFVGNYLRNLAALAVRREPTRPLLFSYYVTHRCRFRCGYCSDGAGAPFAATPVPELDVNNACCLISILRADCDTLDITGGEPMERDDLERILQHARRIGFRTVLNTKGPGLTRRLALLDLCNVLVLSVDALSPAPLAGLIGRSHDIAVELIDNMYALAEKCRNTKTRLVISTVVTPDNLEEVDAILRFTREHGLAFQVSPQIVGTLPHAALRGNQAYRQLLDKVISAKRAGRGVLGVMPYLCGIRDFAKFACHPMLMPVIRPDGRLYYPCLESGQAEVSILQAGSYTAALRQAARQSGPISRCGDRCQIFCHMALSLLQRHPLSAAAELRDWRH